MRKAESPSFSLSGIDETKTLSLVPEDFFPVARLGGQTVIIAKVTEGEIRPGDTVKISNGNKEPLIDVVEEVQIDKASVEIAGPGQSVGLRLKKTKMGSIYKLQRN